MNAKRSNFSTLSLQSRKRMRSQTRFTPWRDTWELQAVGRALMHGTSLFDNDKISTDDKRDLQNAISTVAVWKSKSEQGRIPHSIETTALLAEVLWKDYMSIESTPTMTRSTLELRLAYSSALVRGVNGISDVMQNHRGMAASVSSLCEMVGLPGWLVDMRHDASHSDLPTLPCLRLASKTFLGFLNERYWTPMATQQWKIQQEAVEILMQYKNDAEKASSIAENSISVDTEDFDQNGESSSSSSDDQHVESDYQDDTPWSKFAGTNENRFAALEVVRKKKKPPKKKKRKAKPAKKPPPTFLAHAHHYVKNIPIDVGYRVALMILIWGGIGDLAPGRGCLVPKSTKEFPATVQGEAKIRSMYKPLLRIFYGAWPGFAAALLVHLVDCILGLESNDHPAKANNECETKLFFLNSWVRFVVSREFQMVQHPTVAVMPSNSTNLAKKRELSAQEEAFLQSPAPLDVLKAARLPLNSLCDRIQIHKIQRDIKTSQEMEKLFCKILGDERVAKHGLGSEFDDSPTPQGSKDEATFHNHGQAPPKRLSQGMTLTEMEAMLSESDNEQVKEEAVKPEADSTSSKTNKLSAAWVQCKSWDPCAIGTLPGYTV